jgi:hypothetical protein
MRRSTVAAAVAAVSVAVAAASATYQHLEERRDRRRFPSAVARFVSSTLAGSVFAGTGEGGSSSPGQRHRCTLRSRSHPVTAALPAAACRAKTDGQWPVLAPPSAVTGGWNVFR